MPRRGRAGHMVTSSDTSGLRWSLNRRSISNLLHDGRVSLRGLLYAFVTISVEAALVFGFAIPLIVCATREG